LSQIFYCPLPKQYFGPDFYIEKLFIFIKCIELNTVLIQCKILKKLNVHSLLGVDLTKQWNSIPCAVSITRLRIGFV